MPASVIVHELSTLKDHYVFDPCRVFQGVPGEMFRRWQQHDRFGTRDASGYLGLVIARLSCASVALGVSIIDEIVCVVVLWSTDDPNVPGWMGRT